MHVSDLDSDCKIAFNEAIPMYTILREEQGSLLSPPPPVWAVISCLHPCRSDGRKLYLVFTVSGMKHLHNVSFFFTLERLICATPMNFLFLCHCERNRELAWGAKAPYEDSESGPPKLLCCLPHAFERVSQCW